jgi:microcystin-dependent protein
MTTQTNLGLIWSSTGADTDPGATKYGLGWEAEIPTFQNFNFVLKATEENILSLAEKGAFDWESNITYEPGALARDGVVIYQCLVGNSGQQPSLDTANNYWHTGLVVGRAPTLNDKDRGLLSQKDTVGNVWDGSQLSLASSGDCVLSFEAYNSQVTATIGIMAGELCVAYPSTPIPNGEQMNLYGSPKSAWKIFSEFHRPDVSEVDNAVEDLAGGFLDGQIYGRTGTTASNQDWVKVTTTVAQLAPPPPVAGNGSGWFNLDDGQLYIDIDDGTSSQWIPASPPLIPVYEAASISFDNQTSDKEQLFSSTDVQTAILEAIKLATPVGAIEAYAGAASPTGWVICDGSAYNATLNPLYTDLWNLIGTTYGGTDITNFQVPDLRGEFIRGLDATGSNVATEAGRVLGDNQSDENKQHDHSGPYLTPNASYHYVTGHTDNDLMISHGLWGGGTVSGINSKVLDDGGVESRPRNVAMNYIIKL